MTGRKENLRDFRSLENAGVVNFGNNHKCQVKGYGKVTNGQFTVNRVAYVEACEQGKQHRKGHPIVIDSKIVEPLERLHIDLCGPSIVETLNKKWYILVIVDDFSRFTWVYFLRLKSEVAQTMIEFIKKIEINLKKKVRKIKSDNGYEFKNKVLDSYLTDKGDPHNFSSPYTPQRNGVVERRNMPLCEAARTMLTYANLPQYLWAEAISTTCFTQNISFIDKCFNITLYEIITKVDEGIFLGYSNNTVAYIVLNKRTRKVEETFNLTFDDYYVKHIEKQFEQQSILIESTDETKESNSSDFDYDLIFGVPDWTVDAEVHAADNQTPESSKHTNDSTITSDSTVNSESMLDA
ncbi:uncharacterized protein LOC128127985 [Lactuca sativa]|uniref:uncharacterized protein LOC128127985 n=1 Tax=Lactuca sativa TaxID=4236 RepID=UPI0022AFDEC1|nr:uncharacterized protein LOC128127985 [Lactuca sativa]